MDDTEWLNRLGDLHIAPFCTVCASGNCSSGQCSANTKLSKPGYGRCGCFEQYWIDRVGKHLGHGVLLRTRQSNPMVKPQSRKECFYGGPQGWIVEVGEDERGPYVLLEPAIDDVLASTYPYGRQGWSLRGANPPRKPNRWYFGAILGVHVLTQTRTEAEAREHAMAGMISIRQLGTMATMFSDRIRELAAEFSPNLSANDSHLRSWLINDANPIMAWLGYDLVGLACLSVRSTLIGKRASLDEVIVTASARGRGVGRRLVEYAIEQAKSREVQYIELTSRPSREAANGLYRSMGFELRETNSYRLDLAKKPPRGVDL